MLYSGYYINLNRGADRRAAMEAQLARLDPAAAYRRFTAADGNLLGFTGSTLTDAEIGCLTSHYLLLQMHLGTAAPLHVLEDDAVLSARMVKFVDQVIRMGFLDHYDVLFTTTGVPADFNFIREGRELLRSNVQRADDGTATDIAFNVVPFVASTSSYVVSHRSVRSVCTMIGRELNAGASKPLDILIRDKVADGSLRAACLFPFITSVAPTGLAGSIAREDRHQRSHLAMTLLQHSFFVECDQDAAVALADQLLTAPLTGAQERLHSRLAGFIASDSFKDF